MIVVLVFLLAAYCCNCSDLTEVYCIITSFYFKTICLYISRNGPVELSIILPALRRKLKEAYGYGPVDASKCIEPEITDDIEVIVPVVVILPEADPPRSVHKPAA